ncbi:MAG: hypothetical protein ACOX47_13235 [Bacillota bacterium]
MFKKLKNIAPGLLLSACVAIIAMFLSSLIPGDIIGSHCYGSIGWNGIESYIK